MKTSNKFILGAFLVFVVALMAYNTALKAEYQTGNYKHRYHNYISYNLKDFNEIQINASEMMHVKIIQGDFAVRKHIGAQDSIRFTKVGNKLIIDIDFKGNATDAANRPNYRDFNEIIISCPKLILLQTDSYYQVNGKKPAVYVPHVNFDENDNYNGVELHGLDLDSLSITQKAGKVNLSSSKIGCLFGASYTSSHLKIDKGNKIAKASLSMNDKSYLDMIDTDISQLNCITSDSAHVNLSGASLKHLINKK